MTMKIKIEPAKWRQPLRKAARNTHKLLFGNFKKSVNAIARFTGSDLMIFWTWGSAALHPRLYADTRSAG